MKYNTEQLFEHIQQHVRDNPGVEIDGKKWVRYSMPEMARDTGIHVSTIRMTVPKMEQAGLLQRRNLNEDKRDRGLWISLPR